MRRRRNVSDFVLSASALAILLAALVLYDERVRQEISLRMNGARASTEIVAVGGRARSLAAVLVESAKSQTREHTSMVVFIAAATVLTIFMVRT